MELYHALSEARRLSYALAVLKLVNTTFGRAYALVQRAEAERIDLDKLIDYLKHGGTFECLQAKKT